MQLRSRTDAELKGACAPVIQAPATVEKLAVSSVPLLASPGGGVPAPVDLELRKTAGGLAPVNPLQPIVIASHLGGGVTIGNVGLRVTMEGADVAGEQVGKSTVLFSDVATDTDAAAAVTSVGAELYATLRSPRSPEQLRYRVAVPRGATFVRATDGSVAVVEGGRIVDRIAAPVAADAQGSPVPTSLAIAGSTLLVSVRHRSGDYAYPILVDPYVTAWFNPSSGSSTSSGPSLGENAPQYGSDSAYSITAAPGPYVGAPADWVQLNWNASTSLPVSPAGPGGTWTLYDVDVEIADTTGTIGGASVTASYSCDSNPWGVTLDAPGAIIEQEDSFYAGACNYSANEVATPDVTLNITNWTGTANGGAVAGVGSFLLVVNYGCSSGCPTAGPSGSEGYGPNNQGEPGVPRPNCGKWPVDCATGNQFESQTDLTIPERGPALALTRTYNSLAAAQGATGPFGYGWTSSFSDSLAINQTAGTATVTQANGSTVPFTISGSTYVPPPWVHASLIKNSDGTYTYTLADQTSFRFSSSGQLLSEADRNGEKITAGYDSSGRLATLTDGAGRTITLAYSSKRGGNVVQATDSSGRKVSYSYSNGTLIAVTDAAGGVWAFGYDASHRLTSEKDPRGGTVTTAYNASNQVSSQTDPAGRTRTWTYYSSETVIEQPDGTYTDELFDGQLPTQITQASGSSIAATTDFVYDQNDNVAEVIDPTNRVTTYTYDSAGNQTSATDPMGRITKWTYDSLNDVTSMTDPLGVTTSYTYDSHGDLMGVSTPLSGTNQVRTVTFTRSNSTHPGDITAITDPDGKTTSYGYDTYGDLTSITDPLGNTTTYGYDSIGRRTSMVSPRGNVTGGNPGAYTTSYVYDALSRLTSQTDPLGHTQSWSYDGDGNLVSYTDADNHKTTYSYDPDNEPVTITRPDMSTLQNTFDAAGNLTTQIDGAGQNTTYSYDALERPVSAADPLGRTTSYAYDIDGNLTSVTDANGSVTSYGYDRDHELTTISYSDGRTPNVSYAYNADGDRTSMTDGTGTTTDSYDSLERLTSETNGGGQQVSYTYDLAGNLTSLTYPNGKTVGRSFDSDGRLAGVTDWLGNTTTFSYGPDSNLTSTTFPLNTGNVDNYSYDQADQISSIAMSQGPTTLASLSYTHDPAGLLTNETQTGLPGQASTNYSYTPLDQLASAGAANYSYDRADNPTQLDSNSGYSYDQANELTSAPAASYAYDKRGERTTNTPTGGSTTSYSYDQAGRLISFAPPTGNATIYNYNGDGLRATKTTGTTTSTFAWDGAGSLPLLLNDGSNSYLYGPDDTPIEQIDSNGNPTFLHHDQLSSTRLITSSTGTNIGSFSYNPYGTLSSSAGSATTPFGYAGQYTDPQTGLQYLRARYYDPTTGQFLTRDPAESLTRQPYSYANDNPIDGTDPSGLGCGILDPGGCVNQWTGTDVGADIGNTIAAAAPVVAPLTDIGSGVGCVVAPEACPAILAGNGALQEVFAGTQKAFNPSYSWSDFGLSQAGIVTGTALGGLGALAGAKSGLGWAGQAALGAVLGYPQAMLDVFSLPNANAAELICGP